MKRTLLFFVLFLCLGNFAMAGSGGPDTWGYVWRDQFEPNGPVYNWIDITTKPGVNFVENLSDDNTQGPFNIGFNFRYYWYDVSSFWVGSNGYISFQNAQLSASFPATIPSTNQPHNFMAAQACDLNFDGFGNPAQCFYWTSPTNDTLIISWINVPFWDPVGPNYYQGSNTFQIILTTVDSSITFQYQNQLGTYAGGAATYLISGIENNTGTIGLPVMINPPNLGGYYFNTPYVVKFYYPPTTTYQANDVQAFYNDNPQNGGRFVSNNTSNPWVLRCAVKNTGNVNQNSFNVVGKILNNINTAVVQDNQPSGPMNAGDVAVLTMNNTFSPTVAGTYKMQTRTYLPGDIVPGNDSLRMELVVVDTTALPVRLSFDDGFNDGVGLNWQGGNGGAGMEFTPPFYPCKLTQGHFFILANPNIVGFFMKVFDDSGPNGSPGLELDSVYVPASAIITPGWVSVPLTNPIVFNSGKFYISWNMNGDGLSLGQDLTPPMSNNTYEVLGNAFAIYRSREFEDLMINATIDTVMTSTGLTSLDNDRLRIGECYPNPSGSFTVMNYSASAETREVTCTVFALDGKVMETHSFSPAASGSGKIVINVSGYPAGMYQCQVQSGTILINRRFTVAK